MPIPDRAALDAIEATGIEASILSLCLGDYRVSAIWRQSSAAIESPGWYVETAVFQGPRWVHQGSGWLEYLRLEAMTTPKEVESFLAIINFPHSEDCSPDDHCCTCGAADLDLLRRLFWPLLPQLSPEERAVATRILEG